MFMLTAKTETVVGMCGAKLIYSLSEKLACDIFR